MRAFVLLVAFLIGLALPTFALPARAADDVATAQSVIRSQVEAFSRDDAATAYSYAAPAIHDIFPRADLFLFMVQQSYAPVYRHKSFEFGEARVSDGKIAQRVHIVDANGEAWEALYTLEQQPDGSVKIIGCVLLKAGQAV
jgi:parvulin-like peptidyl-prolyl isomerase